MINRQSLFFFLVPAARNRGESISVSTSEAAGQLRLQASGESVNVSLSKAITTKPLQASGESINVSLCDAAGQLRLQASGESVNVSLSDVSTYPPLQASGESINVSLSDAAGQIRLQASGQSLNVSLSDAVTTQPLQGSGESLNVSLSDAAGQMRLQALGESITVSLSDAAGLMRLQALGESITVSMSQTAGQLRMQASGESVNVSLSNADGTLGNSYLVYTQAAGDVARLRACLSAGSTTATLTGHQANWDGSTWVVAVSKCGVMQSDPPIKKQVAFDAADQLIGQRPDVPTTITLTAIAGGEMTLQWTFIKRASKPLPTAFNLYLNVASTGFDFAAPPAATVTHTGASRYSQTIGPYTTDTVVQAIVRPVSALGAESINTITATATADATAPAAPTGTTWEVVA